MVSSKKRYIFAHNYDIKGCGRKGVGRKGVGRKGCGLILFTMILVSFRFFCSTLSALQSSPLLADLLTPDTALLCDSGGRSPKRDTPTRINTMEDNG